jgi:hypothetical protein
MVTGVMRSYWSVVRCDSGNGLATRDGEHRQPKLARSTALYRIGPSASQTDASGAIYI